jgi:hypothetical protein
MIELLRTRSALLPSLVDGQGGEWNDPPGLERVCTRSLDGMMTLGEVRLRTGGVQTGRFGKEVGFNDREEDVEGVEEQEEEEETAGEEEDWAAAAGKHGSELVSSESSGEALLQASVSEAEV